MATMRSRSFPDSANSREPPLNALKALPVSNDPHAFHVLKTKRSESTQVESLTLSEGTGISGAAFSTGVGRDTRLSLALFTGLTNVRLGYWWDSGIRYEERGRYSQVFPRRGCNVPAAVKNYAATTSIISLEILCAI